MIDLILGTNLVKSSKKLANEVPDKVQRDTLAEFGAAVFMRLTRIGIFGLALAVIPIMILLNQNQLLSKQNDKINLQNNLIEAQRRGSLVILMSNIMDQMNEEIREQKGDPNHVDSLGYSLTDPLIGRIAALSQGFLPYRYLEGDTLTEKATSPERGQLLLALAKSNLDSASYRKIYEGSDFSYSYLVGANLYGVNLNRANLRLADLGKADLRGAGLRGAKLFSAFLSGAGLSGADLRNADLRRTDLSGAFLDKADLGATSLMDADLRRADLGGARNIGVGQLYQAESLFGCINLHDDLEKELREKKPCLFTEEGCPNRTWFSK